MEAISVLPVRASHQTATPPGTPQTTPQGSRGLGDVFAALLLEATSRLDARPADLASFDSRRTSGEPPRRISAAENISSVNREDRRDDAGLRAHSIENDARAARDPIEPNAPAERYAEGHAEVTNDDEIAAPAPQDHAEPSASTAADETPETADDDIQFVEVEDAEAPAAQDQDDPVAKEIAAPAALPTQAQTVAAAAALGAAKALGPDGAAFLALARAAAQSQVPAHAAQQAQAASNIVPAAGRFGTEVGATRVQVSPAAVVAQPNAALGGGATVAALAAETGQTAAQIAQAGVPSAASQIAASAGTGSQNRIGPGNRRGLNGPAANSQAPTGDTATITQGATTGRNGNGAANAAQGAAIAAEVAPGSVPQGQGQGAPISGTTGTIPRNAQTAFAESNNQNATNSGTAGGLSAEAPASEAGVQNRLGQNARTDSAQSPGTPVPSTNDASGAESGQRTNGSRAPADNGQSARPVALESNQNNAPQTARSDTSTQAGLTGPAATQNTPSGTATAVERAMTTASAQRAEGAGQANTNNPAVAGMPGLIQAAGRTPQTLPAQARPAAAPSLPANQVAVHIQRAVAAGQNRIRISLHPAELGQIDVKLNIGNDGTVKAIVSIERPETFELLQRDARGLEKALQDAGLKTDSGSLSFNLRGESEQDATAGAGTGSQEAGTEAPAEPELAPEMIAAANPGGNERILDLHV
ncbi:MAG: flagellar hook-length control protein FliK [Alphaproteobacteria bacterium]